MRIISGTYKGKHIPVPKNFKARPTTDFAKEGLFNILSNHLDFNNLSVLDLFAGTGSIGYEFASRGAKRVDMVEMQPRYADFINKTAQSMDFQQITVYRADVFRLIPTLSYQYDLAFADPPYNLKEIESIPELVMTSTILKPNGLFILEHGAKYNFEGYSNFKENRKYGSVHFSIFMNP